MKQYDIQMQHLKLKRMFSSSPYEISPQTVCPRVRDNTFYRNSNLDYLLSRRHITKARHRLKSSALCAPEVEFPHTYATSAQTT